MPVINLTYVLYMKVKTAFFKKIQENRNGNYVTVKSKIYKIKLVPSDHPYGLTSWPKMHLQHQLHAAEKKKEKRIYQSLHSSTGPVTSAQHPSGFGVNQRAAYKYLLLEDATCK